MLKFPIYMDNHATTPLDPRVLEAIMPYLTTKFGNPASRHHVFGWEAEQGVEKARAQIARLLNAQPKEILFTSGTTESINFSLLGIVEKYRDRGDHIVTSVIEHKATLDTCKYLETKGVRVTYLPVDSEGKVSPQAVKESVTDKTILVSIMAANNEIGTIAELAEIGKITRERGVFFHTDAAQAFGKISLDVEAMNLDLLSLSAHKAYGPKGIGALYVRGKNPAVKLTPLLRGGGHEGGLRSGTLNVPGIVGLGKAAEIAGQEMATESARIGALRDRLEKRIFESVEGTLLNGPRGPSRLYNNLNVSFPQVKAEALMMEMKEVAVSSGSACISSTGEPSFVLRAIGLSKEAAEESLRFGLGRFNTEEEVDYVAEKVIASVKKMRELSPHYRMIKEGLI
ncbi:MAG: IscS subfamily cysteine desulfurase [bacterium]